MGHTVTYFIVEIFAKSGKTQTKLEEP